MGSIEIHLTPLSFPEPPTIVVSEESFVIGRETQVFKTWKDARLKRLSRKHALLEITGNTARLSDLGSTNGTRLNNVPLLANQASQIKQGDVVSFANALKYEVRIVRHASSEDTLVTRKIDRPINLDQVIKDQTLFPQSADSYLDMLCENAESERVGSTQEKKSRWWLVIAALTTAFVAGAATFYFIVGQGSG